MKSYDVDVGGKKYTIEADTDEQLKGAIDHIQGKTATSEKPQEKEKYGMKDAFGSLARGGFVNPEASMAWEIAPEIFKKPVKAAIDPLIQKIPEKASIPKSTVASTMGGITTGPIGTMIGRRVPGNVDVPARKIAEVGADIAIDPRTYIVGGETAAPEAVENAGLKAEAALVKAGENYRVGKAAKLDEVINDYHAKAIAPRAAAKTLGQVKKYESNAAVAVKDIVKNKEGLGILDKSGNPEARIPRTTAEYAQAIDKRMNDVFTEYSNMAKKAKDAGAKFNSGAIEGHLKRVSKDLRFPPEVREYAKRMIKEIQELNGADPLVVQERIKDLNQSLTGFYAGRTQKGVAQVDGSVARLMREELDNKISSAAGEGYKELKKLYGSYKSIQADVTRRAQQVAKSQPGTANDLIDVFSGDRIVRGILTANPTEVMIGSATKGIGKLAAWFRSPDPKIANMFKYVEKYAPVEEDIATTARIAKTGNKAGDMAKFRDMGKGGSAGVSTVAATAGAGVAGAGAVKASQGKEKTGTASTYGWGEKLNKTTASGEKFNPNDMTAAMYGVPFGTKVKVTDTVTGKSVVVKVNDRGPNKRLHRAIDLSKGAWQKLTDKSKGLTNVKIEILDSEGK